MNRHAEKRVYERIDRKAQLSVQKTGSTGQAHDAEMFNYSRQGMYFRSAEKLKIGQEIYIRIYDYDPDDEAFEQQDSHTGYVRWSEELGTSQPGGQYGYGVRYAEPVF